MIITRHIKTEDLDNLAEVYVRAFDGPDIEENWTKQTAKNLLADWFNRQSDLFYLAEKNNRIVGAFVVGIRPWWDGNHLVDGELFVDPDNQNEGIGKKLLKKVLSVAIEKYQPLTWETYTFRGQEFPLSWYKKLGFKEIEEWVMIKSDTNSILDSL